MRLLRAIDFIETRLTEPLPLVRVAEAACLSPYHFSRVFRALIGETMTSYVRRRRLTEAARRLTARDDRLIDLAIAYGFESQAAFSRAFKRQFGVPPGAYRRARRPMPWNYRHALTTDDLQLDEELRAMEPKIVTIPAFKAIGLAQEFSRNTEGDIKALWQRFNGRIKEIENAVGDHSYGLCIGAGDDEFTYMAALEASSLDGIPAGMTGRDVAAQTYAVFTVKLAVEGHRCEQCPRRHASIGHAPGVIARGERERGRDAGEAEGADRKQRAARKRHSLGERERREPTGGPDRRQRDAAECRLEHVGHPALTRQCGGEECNRARSDRRA